MRADDTDAIADARALLQRYPDHAASCEALGGLLMSAQRFADAEARLQRRCSARIHSR